MTEIEAERYFNEYFTDIVKNLLAKYKSTNKAECYDTYQLVEFWETIPGRVKIKHKMAFQDVKNLVNIIDAFLERKIE